MLLLRCPRCGALYENSTSGADQTRRVSEAEAKRLFSGPRSTIAVDREALVALSSRRRAVCHEPALFANAYKRLERRFRGSVLAHATNLIHYRSRWPSDSDVQWPSGYCYSISTALW